jgi:redox-sensitive bicupin YhaK (pirin superfamily)
MHSTVSKLARNLLSPSTFAPLHNRASMTAQIVLRRSSERGHANHGWLDTHHTFSFASYWDSAFNGLGSLTVINEDFVQPNRGFGTHSHREFEIFSYIVQGELEHKDSMNNVETLVRGDVQFTTAGTGISHSEYNRSNKRNHFLQIWVRPDQTKLKPAYHTKRFNDDAKRNALVSIISPVVEAKKKDTIGIHTDFHMSAALLETGKCVQYRIQNPADPGATSKTRQGYVHVVQRETGGGGTVEELRLQVKGSGKDPVVLRDGDGAFLKNVKPGDDILFEKIGNGTTEFLVFDLA